MGICAFFYMLDQFCIVFFQTSMLDWRRALSVCHGYMCIFLYVKLIFLYCFSIDLCWIGGGRWG